MFAYRFHEKYLRFNLQKFYLSFGISEKKSLTHYRCPDTLLSALGSDQARSLGSDLQGTV